MTHPSNRMLSTESMMAVFGPSATIESMLAFEAALARAEADAGLISPKAAEAIAACCQPDRFDADDIARRAVRAGSLAIPLVSDLTTFVAEIDQGAAAHVHRGATSQDVIDTGLVLQLRNALRLLRADLNRIELASAKLAREHAATAMVGRTLLQSGPLITFGLKAAHWHGAVRRGNKRLTAAADEAFILQFGGAVGTLSAVGEKGLEVAEKLAARLDLSLPEAPWHSQRDRIVALGSAVAMQPTA